MRKAELQNLCAGNKVISKKDNTILEVVGMENDKVILSNGKLYAQSTICRWYDLAPVETVEEKTVEEKPEQPKFKLGDKVKNGLGQIGEVVSVPHLVSYNGRLVMDGYRVRFTEDGETFIKSYSETYEGLTKVEKPVEPIKPTITEEKSAVNKNHEEHTGKANSHVVEGKNSIEELFYRFSRVLDEHSCHFKQNKEYVAVLSPRKKGTLLQLKPNKQGSIHIDLKKSVWKKLKDAYKVELEKTYSAYVYDKTRGYIRLRNMEDVNTFTVLLLTALS